jgi:hypothetical protein
MCEGLTGNASADEQDGYSPVVDWATIRMMLTVSVKYGLHATQVDFNNTLIQDPLKEPMFMSLPPGFDQQTGQCLRRTNCKSLYGHKFTAKLLRDTLTNKLGFYVSPSDHCLFIWHYFIIINWVNDQLLLTKYPTVALEIVEAMHKAGLILDIESNSGSITNYVRIQIQEEDNGTLLLTLSGLIDQILEAMQRTLQPRRPSVQSSNRLHSRASITTDPLSA